MTAAPFRILLRQTKRRPRCLSRFVDVECLNGAVLCAQQWVVWSNAAGRGKLDKYDGYRVYARDESGSWLQVADGTLKDARLAWTKEDDARIEQLPDVRPLIGQQGTTRHGKAWSLRGEARPKSRLAQLVQNIQQRK